MFFIINPQWIYIFKGKFMRIMLNILKVRRIFAELMSTDEFRMRCILQQISNVCPLLETLYRCQTCFSRTIERSFIAVILNKQYIYIYMCMHACVRMFIALARISFETGKKQEYEKINTICRVCLVNKSIQLGARIINRVFEKY